MRTLLTLACGAALLGLFGCGNSAPGPEESAKNADQMRDQVHETVRTVVAGLREKGIEVTEATGSYSACGMQNPQVEYGAGFGTTPESGTIEEQIEAAREVIEGLGLDMVESDTPNYVSTDAAKAEIRVSAKESRQDDSILNVEVVHECIDTDEGVVDERISLDADTIE